MRGGSQGIELAAGKLLFETSKFAISKSKEAYDILYAVGAGTAIGIASGETVRGSYELWKGTNRSNQKAKQLRWDYRSLRRRFKGDVVIDEGSNYDQETHIPGEPGYRGTGFIGKHQFRGGYRGSKKRTSTRRRGCSCESLLRRVLAQSRQRKYRR